MNEVAGIKLMAVHLTVPRSPELIFKFFTQYEPDIQLLSMNNSHILQFFLWKMHFSEIILTCKNQ